MNLMNQTVALTFLGLLVTLKLVSASTQVLNRSVFLGQQTGRNFGEALASGDLNNDGFQNLLVELWGEDNNLWLVLFGNASMDNFDFQAFPEKVISISDFGYLDDIAGDGIDDLGIIEERPIHISVYAGGVLNMDFSFSCCQQLKENNFVYSVAIGDLNGDGVKDILSGNTSNKIYLCFSSPANAAPRLTGFRDVPADQNGQVSVVWFKSGWDGGKLQIFQVERSIASAGSYKVTFDASGLSSGVYIYRLKTNRGFVQYRKMMLIR